MIYYQADFLRQYPDIEDESVTLCLSSVYEEILAVMRTRNSVQTLQSGEHQ